MAFLWQSNKKPEEKLQKTKKPSKKPKKPKKPMGFLNQKTQKTQQKTRGFLKVGFFDDATLPSSLRRGTPHHTVRAMA